MAEVIFVMFILLFVVSIWNIAPGLDLDGVFMARFMHPGLHAYISACLWHVYCTYRHTYLHLARRNAYLYTCAHM